MIRTVLRTEHVTMQFGGVIAVNDLNIVVKEHEIIALIGPNGAGKTTAFNDITGVYTPTRGRVLYTKANGQEIDITGKKPSDKFLERAQYVGMFILFGLLIFANLNDILRLFGLL